MISIVIPAYNNHEITEECLEQIYAVGTEDYEIVLIDNGSDPHYKLEYYGQIIRNEENRGFPAAVNQGIRAAKGDIIVLLNNDVIVTPGWTDKLVKALDEYAIVGPVSNYVSGMQHVSAPPYTDTDSLNKAAAKWEEDHKGETQEVTFIIGFCMAFRKSLFEEIGEFDETHWPCSGEEISFCRNAREKGYKVGIVRDCYLHHEGSQTFKVMDVDYQAIIRRNDDYLIEKYGPDVYRQEIEQPKGDIQVDGVRLNLGCGYRHIDGYVNIDNRAVVGPDMVCDVIQGLPYPDNSVDEVRAHDFLEHIPQPSMVPVMEDIYRVLKPGGIVDISVPSTDGRGAFQDPTHCLDPAMRVLTSDLQWVELGNILIGDELFGIDEYPANGRGSKRRLLPSTVESIRYIKNSAYRLIFEDGKEIIASADHRFIGQVNCGSSNTTWKPVSEISCGDLLRVVVPAWPGPGYEEGWIGGMIDGEGSLRTRTKCDGTNTRSGVAGGGSSLTITQKHGPVYDRVIMYLRSHNYHFGERVQIQDQTWRKNPSSIGRVEIHRTDEIIRLLGQARPSRLPKEWWHGCRLSGTNGDGWVKVACIEEVGERTLVDIQTSTRTFVVEGLATHNCSFWNRNSFYYYTDKASRDLYGIKALFQIEKLEDEWTSRQLRIVHTHFIGKAIK